MKRLGVRTATPSPAMVRNTSPPRTGDSEFRVSRSPPARIRRLTIFGRPSESDPTRCSESGNGKRVARIRLAFARWRITRSPRSVKGTVCGDVVGKLSRAARLSLCWQIEITARTLELRGGTTKTPPCRLAGSVAGQGNPMVPKPCPVHSRLGEREEHTRICRITSRTEWIFGPFFRGGA
jgi:hypothetical protein